MEKRLGHGLSKDELRMNMAALQRIDPFICQIVQSASQVRPLVVASKSKSNFNQTLISFVVSSAEK